MAASCSTIRAVTVTTAARLTTLAMLVLAALTTHAQTKANDPFRAAEPFASPRIAALRLAVAQKQTAALEQFWAGVRVSGTPLVEPVPREARYSFVTFVYQGSERTRNVVVVDGVAVAVGGVDPRNSEMTRLAGTDVWYRTYKVRNDARFIYKVSENDPLTSFIDPSRMSDSKLDPLNPRVFSNTGQSYVELPDAPSQDVTLHPGAGRGSVEKTTFHSRTLGNDRDVWIYTPHDFRGGAETYPLVVVLDGGAYTTLVPVPTILDNLIAQRRIPPVVAVLVNTAAGQRDKEESCMTSFGDLLANEIVPSMRERYGTTTNPQLTVIGGSSRGALASSCAAFQHPEVFGKVLSQSGSYWWNPDANPGTEFLTGQFARSPKLPLQFYIEAGEMEIDMQLATNRRLRDVLKAKGYAVDYREFNGNHTYLAWRGTFADGVISLLGRGTPAAQR